MSISINLDRNKEITNKMKLHDSVCVCACMCMSTCNDLDFKSNLKVLVEDLHESIIHT